MHSDLAQLLVLQERDSKILEAKKDLEKIPQEAAKIKEGLSAKLQALKSAKQSYLVAQNAVKQVDLDRQTRKDTITKLKMRQGETKKNEEYQMLGHEIIRYGKEVDELETKELELMEAVDAKKTERAEAERKLEEEKAFAAELSKDLMAKKKNAEAKIAEIQAERDSLIAKVSAEPRELYERILAKKGGNAVVLITETGQCLGCNMKLPSSTLHKVLADDELVQCGECSRILYNA